MIQENKALDASANVSVPSPRLKQWQNATLALLFLGYAGYYWCRVDLSAATPLLIKQFGHQGIDKVAIGRIASLGTLCYAFGKFINGSVVDFMGGRRMFLLGMLGAVLCNLLFGLGGVPFFTLAWMANRLVQSTGWAGMVRITSRWFSHSTYGTAMGIISLSFVLGEVFWKLVLGALISNGLGWQGVFLISAGALTPVLILTFFLVKESPKDIGEPEPLANPLNLFGAQGQEAGPGSISDLLGPLLRSPVFWVVCLLSLGTTLVRNTFDNWTPQYLTEVVKMESGAATTASSVFPFFGAVSIVLCGFLSDRLGRNGRAALIFFGMLLSVPALLALGYLHQDGSAMLPLAALGVVAFCVIGPYAFLAGAMALDFGGKRGSSTASGWIDGVGYLGGIFAGEGIGSLSEKSGWTTAFLVLAGVACLSTVAAGVYWWLQNRPQNVAIHTEQL